MRRAHPADLPLLVDLMADFYAEAGYDLNRELASGAFESVLADGRLGTIWIIQDGEQDVGHIVLTYRFAMGHAGTIAELDDLYVGAPHRNKGLGSAAVREVRDFCENSGIRALTVEVSFTNAPAQKAYRRAGFSEASDRQLLVLPLAPPTHNL